MIDRATIDRIMDAAQIVEVVSEFVTLRKRGVNYIGLCPFHNERTPSFSVSPSKGLCKCFSCGKGGNVVHFLMEHEQLTYVEALKWLARKYNIEVKERELTEEEKQANNIRESLFIVNQFANEYFQRILQTTTEGRSIGMTYFRSRGFRDDIIKKFQLGYSLDTRDALATEAKRKGYREEFLEKAGLCYKTSDGKLRDRFWGRVIFPVHTLSGKVVAFGGRVLNAATKNVQMKYVNSPESEVYHKSRELYGIYLAKQSIVKQDRCFLVEGYTDVISMHQSGIENVVASSGTALTTEQIRLIRRFTQNVTVLYDGDSAGIKASLRGIDMLLEEGMNIKVCLLPDGDDPDSFARKHNASEYQDYINKHETDFIRFKTNLLLEEAGHDPIKRVELINSIVKTISVIPEAITRSVYIRECSQMLQTDERVLVEAVAKQLPKSQYKASTNRQPAIQKEGTGTNNNVQGNASAGENASEKAVETNVSKPKQQDTTESELIRIIVRHGEKTVCYAEAEDGSTVPVNVIEYIYQSLAQDQLELTSPLYRSMLDDAAAHAYDDGFTAERYFMHHPNPEFSNAASEFIVDRYQLSKYHTKGQRILSEEERLPDLVPRLLLDFKMKVVDDELQKTLKELQDPAVASDQERCSSLMSRYMRFHSIQSQMAHSAGDRVVLKT